MSTMQLVANHDYLEMILGVVGPCRSSICRMLLLCVLQHCSKVLSVAVCVLTRH